MALLPPYPILCSRKLIALGDQPLSKRFPAVTLESITGSRGKVCLSRLLEEN